MQLPTLLKRLATQRKGLMLALAFISIACIASLLVMLLSSLGLLEQKAEQPRPISTAAAEVGAAAVGGPGSAAAVFAGGVRVSPRSLQVSDAGV